MVKSYTSLGTLSGCLLTLLLGLAVPATADGRTDTLVRQLASAGVYESLCPSVEFGTGMPELLAEAGLSKEDLLPGGRYRGMMLDHMRDLKAITQVSGADACQRALQLYGPRGTAFRDLLRARGQ